MKSPKSKSTRKRSRNEPYRSRPGKHGVKRQKASSRKNSGIEKRYFDAKQPGSFSAVSGFIRNNRDIDEKKFKEWALKQDTVTLHQPARKHFPRRKVLVFEAGELLQIDLMDFQSLSEFNQGFNYVLTAIDAFSKFAYAIPLKRKTAKDVLKALQTIIKDIKPKKIQTDRGLEFVNQTISDWAKSNGIRMYSTYNYDIKASIVERFIRTFKGRLYRYFTQNSTSVYIDVLSSIINSYNETFHRSIKMTPKQARKKSNETLVYENLYRNTRPLYKRVAKFKVNDPVRVSRYPNIFAKAYTQNFSTEYFFIDKVEHTEPPVYKLRDFAGEKLLGTFYEQELTKISVDRNKTFKIEKVLEEKGNKVLVKYLGWPMKFSEWIPKKRILQAYKKS